MSNGKPSRVFDYVFIGGLLIALIYAIIRILGIVGMWPYHFPGRW